jgi:Transglycosylase SLT domain
MGGQTEGMVMRKKQRHRVSTLAIAVSFCAVLTVDAPPTTPSIMAERPVPPSPEDVVVLEELLDWVRGGPRVTDYSPITAQSGGLADAVRTRRRSFELFRLFNGEGMRDRMLASLPYGKLIRQAARRHQVDGLLVAAVMQTESSFRPGAVSAVGAVGLMQIMPATAELFRVEAYSDPAANIDLGARYLGFLVHLFDGNIDLALAAYNAGPGSVLRFNGIPPFGETRHFVEQVLERYVQYHQEIWRQAGGAAVLVPGSPA